MHYSRELFSCLHLSSLLFSHPMLSSPHRHLQARGLTQNKQNPKFQIMQTCQDAFSLGLTLWLVAYLQLQPFWASSQFVACACSCPQGAPLSGTVWARQTLLFCSGFYIAPGSAPSGHSKLGLKSGLSTFLFSTH